MAALLGETQLCSGDVVLTAGQLQRQAVTCGTSREAGPAHLQTWLFAVGTRMVDCGEPRWHTLNFRTANFFVKGSLREMFSHGWIKARICTCFLERCTLQYATAPRRGKMHLRSCGTGFVPSGIFFEVVPRVLNTMNILWHF